IETIDIDLQATPRGGEYQPLITVKELPCWPSRPLYDQLAEGEELRRAGTDLESAWGARPVGKLRLQRGQDFDLVVLGIAPGAFRTSCRELIDASSMWRNRVERVKAVPTQAAKVGMNRTPADLGWVQREPAIVGAYVEPLDTWGDMTQVLDKESWAAADNAQ